MKKGLTAALLLCLALASQGPAQASPLRADVIWARSTAGQPITLDGVLDESAWAKAESVIIQYRVNTGDPGSGWKEEGGVIATDKTYATLKFLTVGNYLYMGATVKDASIGGSNLFNRFDGFLMGIKDHANASRPAPVSEYLYSWWNPDDSLGAISTSAQPTFRGRWSFNNLTPRDSTMIANWDARIKVQGTPNSDVVPDTGYTVEMRFNLASEGYDVTQAAGDIVEFNISVYDCDWFWPLQIPKFSINRTWWQDPWGNTAYYSDVKMHASPSVTINSGAAPFVGPDLVIPNAASYASPVIDGRLTDAVWQAAPKLDIRYGDTALRAGYSGTGPYRSGQYQPPVNAGQASIVDPGDATVRYFFKGDSLFLGFDVRDKAVQYVAANTDRWDGFTVTIDDRGVRNADHVLTPRQLTFQVGPTGLALPQDYLPYMRDTLFAAKVALQLKGGTTVDTFGVTPDSGYTAELMIDLTKLGYPHGLGDGILYFGVDLMDGDSFIPFTDSYGSRTWWFLEHGGPDGPAFAYMDPATQLATAVGDGPTGNRRLALLGNAPNPFARSTTIRYSLPEASNVRLEVIDVDGRRVSSRALGLQQAGNQEVRFDRTRGDKNGVYFYRLMFSDPGTGASRSTLSGRMLLLD